jgi:hypothetical protein
VTRVFRRRSPRDITEILDNMTELYTSAGGIFLGAEYANRDGANERRAIVRRRMIWNRRSDFGAESSGSSVSGYAA